MWMRVLMYECFDKSIGSIDENNPAVLRKICVEGQRTPLVRLWPFLFCSPIFMPTKPLEPRGHVQAIEHNHYLFFLHFLSCTFTFLLLF